MNKYKKNAELIKKKEGKAGEKNVYRFYLCIFSFRQVLVRSGLKIKLLNSIRRLFKGNADKTGANTVPLETCFLKGTPHQADLMSHLNKMCIFISLCFHFTKSTLK